MLGALSRGFSFGSAAFARNFAHEAIMQQLKESAIKTGEEFKNPQIKAFFNMWADMMYKEGTQLETEKDAQVYVTEMEDELDKLYAHARERYEPEEE